MPRKQVGAIDKDLLDRVDEARGDVPRVKFVERALEAALAGRAEVRGNVGPTTTTAQSAPPEEPLNETPLPRVARRHWS